MTAQETWKSNVDAQKALDRFLKDFGSDFFASIRERQLPVTSTAQGEVAIHENSRLMERWQGSQDALSIIEGMAGASGSNGKMPAVKRLEPMPNTTQNE